MIDLIIVDLCAVLLAPELKVKLLASQVEKDGIPLACFADLPRDTIRRALKAKQYLQLFDNIIYAERLNTMSSRELRMLAAPSTLWMRTPGDVEYARVLPFLSPRRRLLPKMLRTLPLADDDISSL